MKYKTFRALVITGVALLAGLWLWSYVRAQDEHKQAYMARVAETQQAVQAGSSQSPALAGDVGGQTPEAYLLVTLGGLASEEKLKDVTGGKGSKINVYNEGGRWARAKVDHDRDEKWDEKWSLDGAVVVRQIAPDDDENYTRELRRVNDRWLSPGDAAFVAADAAAPAAIPTDPAPAVTAPAAAAAASSGRPVDDDVLRALQGPAQEKIKDATSGTPYKINLYSDDRVRWNRVKIDLDRDEKWDEKWTIAADGAIEREVAPADDEVYSETYARSGDAWVRR